MKKRVEYCGNATAVDEDAYEILVKVTKDQSATMKDVASELIRIGYMMAYGGARCS